MHVLLAGISVIWYRPDGDAVQLRKLPGFLESNGSQFYMCINCIDWYKLQLGVSMGVSLSFFAFSVTDRCNLRPLLFVDHLG